MTSSDRYAVVGNPVEHSRSPAIHAAFAASTGEAVDYGRVLCPLDAFEATVRAYADSGARGCNITVPFKIEAWRVAARHSGRAALAQAANLLRFDAEGWFADNTDGIGLVRDITQNAGVEIAERRVLLIGAGGAAAGALGSLIAARPAFITVVNRTAASADALAERHRDWARRHDTVLDSAALDDAGEAFDIVINATAASLQGAALPVAPSVLREGGLALDMMYGPAAQPFLDWAARHGAVPRDGLGMLVEQAAEAFFVWRGVHPQTAPVLALLRRDIA